MANKPKSSSQRAGARERARQRAAAERRRKRLQLFVGTGAAVVVILIVGVVLLVRYISITARTTQPASADALTVDGVQCLGSESLNYHIHAHLTLYQDGKPVTLPAYIGIPFSSAVPGSTCFYWLHVHDTTGVVHIESPTPQQYTLGQFLDVWQRTAQLDAQGKAGAAVDDSFVRALKAANPNDIHVYVGDKEVSDYAGIALTAHELITIEIGAPLQPPTTDYTFPAGE